MSESESFVSVRLLKPLVKKLTALSGKFSDSPDKRAEEIRKIGNIFGQPLDLARHYIVPHCRYDNPLDHFEAQQSVTSTRSPVFSAIDIFLKGNFPLVKEGNRHLFVLSDAGMGKTSLLMMIKLTHLMAFWPPEYDCLLLKIGEDTLDTIAAHPNKAHTILLLDALDEDPLAWSNIKERLLKILAVTDSYYRVIISCRTQFFPKVDADLFGRSGQVRIGRHSCAMIFLTLFDNAQVSHYLAKRFPDYLHIFRNPKRWRVEQLVLGMRSLRFCPLLLSHAHDILEVSGSETGQWNAYTLYEALIGNWLSREEDALRKFADPPDRKDLRAICTAIAVYLQQEGRRTLSRHALGDLVARFPVARHLEHFDVRECSFLNCNAQGDLRFSYYSIQEFLVAHAMMNKSVVPDIVGDPARPTASAESISVDKPIRATDQLLVFLKDASDGLLDFSLLGQLDLGDQSYPLISQLHFYDRLADDSRGPMMQLILAGEFLMGSPQGIGREREHPQHRVRIATPFALGTYPVTFAEYDYFCEARGREKPSDRGWGRGRRPVVYVSRQDALDYCAWLTRETGRHYRLPSEAEWEYAVRAGMQTRYWWGDAFDHGSGADYEDRANCHGCGSLWDDKGTSPAGSFPPNPFGLYDMSGNVWEWMDDCWHKNYQDAPEDGSIWGATDGGDCSRRVVRGGSWVDAPNFLRSAFRDKNFAHEADGNLGFRLVRIL